MPKTKFQEVVFGLMMVIAMAYAMVAYNIALHSGLSGQVFIDALKALPLIGAVAFVFETFLVGKIAHQVVAKILDPGKDKLILITVATSCIIVAIMCPIMSLVGTLLFNFTGMEHILTNWIQGWVLSFPMALCWQLFYAGPAVRWVFRHLFADNKK